MCRCFYEEEIWQNNQKGLNGWRKGGRVFLFQKFTFKICQGRTLVWKVNRFSSKRCKTHKKYTRQAIQSTNSRYKKVAIKIVSNKDYVTFSQAEAEAAQSAG